MSNAARLLDAWEQARTQSPLERALTLLAVACPDLTAEAREALPIGRRDAHLLTMREQLFGTDLVSVASCPGCCERVELTLQTSALRVGPTGEIQEPLALTVGEYTVRFRLPASRDLRALSGPEHSTDHPIELFADTTDAGLESQTLTAVGRRLLAVCLLDVERQGTLISPETLPDQVVDAITGAMAHADPQADIRLALTCPACGLQWEAAFDIAAYLWIEMNGWAERTLQEVHLLAAAYGWSEAAILALTPLRRRLYLEMVNG